MKNLEFNGIETLVTHSKDQPNDSFFLYRGQSGDFPLLPKVARTRPDHDSTDAEKRLLAELRRRGSMLFNSSVDDWGLLCIAQHHGAATRLLDWSANPLVALWMALAENSSKDQTHAYVYAFEVKNEWLVKESDKDPFQTKRTRVLQPPLNNQRVAAQAGWFTAHRFNTRPTGTKRGNRFVPLEIQKDYGTNIAKYKVPVNQRASLLRQLDKLGVNAQTMFPGLEGLCRHMGWRYECELDLLVQ